MRRTPAIPMFHSSILVTASLSGLLSLHPLFLPVQEKKTGYVKEQETKKWIKGEVEGAGEGKVIIAGEMDSETPPTAAPAVPTVSKGPSSSSGPGPGPLCKSNTQTVLDQLSDSTFDFGVVAVYSCPNSCSSIRNNNDDSISNNEKSDKNTSHNIAENVSTSHNITASAGHVYYEYIVVQPPADF